MSCISVGKGLPTPRRSWSIDCGDISKTNGPEYTFPLGPLDPKQSTAAKYEGLGTKQGQASARVYRTTLIWDKDHGLILGQIRGTCIHFFLLSRIYLFWHHFQG